MRRRPTFPTAANTPPKSSRTFQIPELELSNVTLSEAVATLLQAYADICAHTNEQPLNLNITLPNDLDTRVDFHLLNRSFLSALFSISSAYETTFDLTNSELSFLKISDLPPLDPKKQGTRRWTSPLNFESKLSHLLRTNDTLNGLALPNDQRSIDTLLAKLGMTPLGAQTSLSYDTSSLLSQQNPEGHRRLMVLIKSLYNTTSIQHRQESTLISSTHDLGLSSSYYLPDQLDQQLATINSGSNTSLEVAPTVLIRPGETATVELKRDLISPGANGESDNDWIGLQIQTQVNGYGFGYHPEIELESRPGPDTLSPAASILGSAQFNLGDIAPGAHALVEHQTTPDGQHQYVITRISQIDATGRPIAPRESSSP